MDGTELCESFAVKWTDEVRWTDERAGVRPTDSTHRMKILANGMLLFQRRGNGELVLAAPSAWVLAKGPWGDPIH